MWIDQLKQNPKALSAHHEEYGYFILYYFFVTYGFGLPWHDERDPVTIELLVDQLPDSVEKRDSFRNFMLGCHAGRGFDGKYVGSVALLAGYALLLAGAVRVMLVARDRFGFLLAAGLAAMLAFHVVVNIDMTIGVMPITGIPVPFLSYGGSAILTDFAAVGILRNIDLQRDKFEF
jgi:hypothetical protein